MISIGGPPNYRQYFYRIIPDPLTQEMEFYAGTADAYAVRPHSGRTVKAGSDLSKFSGLSFGYTYIGYNMRREPFNDPRVRRALGMPSMWIRLFIRPFRSGERITGPLRSRRIIQWG